MSSGTITAAEYSRTESATDSFLPPPCSTWTSETLTGRSLESIAAWLTQSREGSRVRISRARARKPASAASVPGFGRKCLEPFAWYDPASCSWKTRQQSFLEAWETFSQIYPRWGWMRNGAAYRLPHLVPRTSATGRGYLATPTATANQLCPSMMKHPGCRKMASLEFGKQKIHPWEWEWLMGFPIEWTALEPLATHRFQSWRQLHTGF